MKKAVAFFLAAGGLVFAQTGLMGGSDGIHQQNARTLGQWVFSIGTGGDATMDSWALSRGGLYTADKNSYTFNGGDFTLSGNINAAVGLLDFLDLGVSLPLYYDYAESDGPSEDLDMKAASRGDLEIWLKGRVPFDEKSVIGLAAMLDFYIPTGENSVGVRPRHSWYLNGEGFTHPYSADAFAMAANLIMTVDLTKRNIPFRINGDAGFVLATGDGQSNVLLYGLGVNWIASPWMDIFAEFSGEFRVQDTDYPREAIVDPMLVTPGIRLHLPYNIDFALGLDVAVRALGNLGYGLNTEMEDVFLYYVKYVNEKGKVAKYGYVSTPNFAGTAALTWRFGNIVKDADEDGVKDNKDQCANTPKGAVVDTLGCPVDSDKDGVFDGFDKCDKTPEGAKVNSLGCPMDGDKDGVFDGIDQCPDSKPGVNIGVNGCEVDFDKDGVGDSNDKCPNTKPGVKVDSVGCAIDSDKDGVTDDVDQCADTPAGFPVDSVGCPIDSDKDGVVDPLDKCLNTPAGLAVDSLGCPIDSDKDGVADAFDKCPNTKPGAEVNAEGCEGDFDSDGIADAVDQCPNTKKGTPVDSTGCPADTDKDGVFDYLDKCADTPAGVTVDNTGCPADFDKDGVADDFDKCPNTKVGVSVDSTGCPMDTDKDGVFDGLDKCADTPVDVSVDSTGCPMDTDKDGVADYLDKCAYTLAGTKTDDKGCPLNKREDLNKLKQGIEFQTNSTKFTKNSFGTLNDIVALLKAAPNANLEVQGHTDNVGSAKKNMDLSQQRAQAVVDYLVQNGIDAARLRAVGYGGEKPVASNGTKKGRKQNRRVELIPFEK